jgi:hypothetical protein
VDLGPSVMLREASAHGRIIRAASPASQVGQLWGMPSTRHTGPVMTLANMRSIGAHGIEAGCECGRRAVVDVSGLSGDVEVPTLRRRLRCLAGGSRPNDVGRTCGSIGGRGWVEKV